MARKIQKEDLYDLFFEFYYRCVKLRLRNENEKINETVTTAYQNLLIQQLEYLRPEKYDLKTFVAGRKTTGELIVREDPFPTFDVPIFQLRSELEQGKRFSKTEEHLYELYRKQGYPIHSERDQQLIVAQDKIHTTTCCMLLPFINEYTFDVLPQTVYNANSDIIHRILPNMPSSVLRADLRRRKRTLPTNGAKVKFIGTSILQELLLKEILYDGSIYLLYRLSTGNGDLCGVYETRDQFFYSIFQSSIGHEYLTEGIETLVLYCYASLVLGGKYLLPDLHEAVKILDCEKLEASGFGQGGQLRNAYDREEPRRTGEYEAGEASIQGYIRRLPAGQKASREAVELAESLGYELEQNETYVRPFIRQVFRLKEK